MIGSEGRICSLTAVAIQSGGKIEGNAQGFAIIRSGNRIGKHWPNLFAEEAVYVITAQ